MKYTDLGDKGPDFIREMDSQGYRGSRDSADDAGKKEYSGKIVKPGDVVKQGANALDNAFNHAEDDWSADFERRMKNEAEEDAFMSKLGGLKTWQVVIMNNYYRGKYSDYSGRYFYVLATSAEEAEQVVLDNADAILQDLLAMKSHNGKKILPRGSAVPITADRIGKIEDGTVAGRMSTAGFKKMYSPQGVMMVKLTNGAIVDVQGQEQGVAEGSIKDVEAKIRTHDQRKADREQAGDPYVAHEIHSHNVIRKQLLDKRKRAQAAYHKKMDSEGVAEAEVDEASLAQMRDYFNQADSDSVKVDRNYDAPSKKQNPLGVPPEIQALVNKMYHAGKISPQEFEILRKFQQKTKINVGIREADKNPYAIGMAQAMKSTGDKPPLKKSTINKAHKIARAIEKGE